MKLSGKTKVLLTGFTGQVGSEIAATLPPNYELVLARREGEEFLDLANFAAVRELMRDIRPDIIINPAAYTAVDKAESEQELAALINADVPRVLAEEAKKIDALLIHFSTDYVFNGDASHAPWKETDLPDPLNVYGKTKLAGEMFIAESKCRHLIFRTSWVFGVHGHNFVKTILRLAAEKEVLTIVKDQIGAPTSAGFLAEMTWAAVEKLKVGASENSASYGLYHLTCSGECSWYEFASEIVRITRQKHQHLKVNEITGILTSAYKTPAIRPLNSRLDCSKFEKVFGRARVDWKTALEAVFLRLN
jgi:dTDP-4-dehydrorhamnose reductase